MERVIDGKGYFGTPDGLSINVCLAVVFGDGSPRVEISSISDPSRLIPIHAIDRAARCFLYELTSELRRQAYRESAPRTDLKPKDRVSGKRTRARVVT